MSFGRIGDEIPSESHIHRQSRQDLPCVLDVGEETRLPKTTIRIRLVRKCSQEAGRLILQKSRQARKIPASASERAIRDIALLAAVFNSDLQRIISVGPKNVVIQRVGVLNRVGGCVKAWTYD